MNKLEFRFAAWVVRARWLIIVASFVLIALAASGVRHLTVTQSYRVYFGPDDPNLVAYENLENTYTKDDSIILVMAPKDGQVFTREFLSVVESVSKQAWQLPYANRVDSITNFQHTEADGDDLVVADLIRDATNFSDEQLGRVKNIALGEPLLRNSLIADDAKVTAVNVNVLLPGLSETEELPLVIKRARELVAETESRHPEVDIYISGMTAMHNAMSEAAFSDMSVLAPISFGVMFLLVAFLAGGVIGTITTLFVFSMSVAGAMGLSGYLGFPVTPTGSSAPNIILTVAVANSVHILISYFHELREGSAKHDAIQESLRINLNPVSLASITTAMGFLAMNFSVSPPFQQMGTTVAMGVLISFVLSITFLPAMLAILPTGRIRQKSMEDSWVQAFGDFVVRRRRGLLWGTAIFIVALIANVPRNQFNEVFYHWFDKKMEFRIATDFMLDNLTGLYQVHYSLDSGESGGISEPEFLRLTDEFSEWWRAQPETEHVKSITDTMKRLNKNMHGDDQAMYKLPGSRDLAAQYLLLYEMSLPYGLDLNNQINVDKSTTRVIATLKPILMSETLAITGRASDWLDEHAPQIGHDKGSGMVMMATHMTMRNVVTMVYGTTAALALISIVIVLALRSVKLGALSFIANLAPIAMGYGIWALIDGEIGMGLSIVGSMTFGIVVDDTVHFLSKYLRARREQDLSAEDAVRYAFKTVGRALIVTSIVLVAGFLVLSTSQFAVNSKMGLSVAIVIVCALFTVLLFLPPLLMKLDHDKARRPKT
ncbi:MAG: putative RND superfamily exporter protein [Gammaproteobacteria bacterium]|jgi:predicted RND superfamily exporter protein